MAFKFVILLAVVSAASAGVIDAGWQAPSHGWQQQAAGWQQPTIIKQVQPALVKQVVHEAPANYEFNYEVHDTHTGDIKRQHEKAENGQVSGQYSLVDPDGYRRVVSRILSRECHQTFQTVEPP
jgi:Na+-translocating ferredoxin:NAD+ oxidoreductase RnfG subunit